MTFDYDALGPFIIDCDTGRDDALAIWIALALGLPLTTVIASYGNVALPQVADNCARVLALAGRADIPVYCAADAPSREHRLLKDLVRPRQLASGNGLCNLSLPEGKTSPFPCAPGQLPETIAALAEKHGPLDYIITGPATNFAAVCRTLKEKTHGTVRRVVMMGGKFGPLWQEIPGADFNLACDPYAVRTIMETGFEIGFVPMNATWPIVLTLDELDALKAGNAPGRTAKDLMIAHARHFAPEPVFRFHDPSVIMAALAPENFAPARLAINCEEESPEFGRLYEDKAGFSCALYQADEALRHDFLNRMLAALGLSF